MKLIVSKYEVALFPKDFYSSDFNELLEEIKVGISDFDGTNIVIPVPKDAPREIFRLILKSKDNGIECSISLEKISISWRNLDEKNEFNKTLDEIKSLVERLATIILNHTSTKKMARIGYIKEFFYVSEKPIDLLSGKTVFVKIAKGVRNFFFQFTYDLELGIWERCNEVITIGSGKKTTTVGKKSTALMLMDDINTFQGDDVKWGIGKVKEFIDEADEKIKESDLLSRFLKIT